MQFSRGLSFDPITRPSLTQAVFWTSGWLIDGAVGELPWMPVKDASNLISHIYMLATSWTTHGTTYIISIFLLPCFISTKQKLSWWITKQGQCLLFCFLWIRCIPQSNRSVVEAMEFSRSFVDKLVWRLMTIGAPKVLWQNIGVHIEQLLCTKIF